ncbi:hypothetical protein SRHO_G00277300 [Serrasalmus rhombeus]
MPCQWGSQQTMKKPRASDEEAPHKLLTATQHPEDYCHLVRQDGGSARTAKLTLYLRGERETRAPDDVLIRRMPRKHRDHLAERERKSKHHFLRALYLWMFLPLVPRAGGYFMSDSKAVLQGCSDYWTLQDRSTIPQLFQITVCVDVRVMTPGEWTAFSFTSPRPPYYDLALQGDDSALYAWLLGVRHRFPVQLEQGRWYQLCLRRDAMQDSFSLEVSGNPDPQQRTVIARATPPIGTLILGCQPRDASPGVTMATLELYLFRVWNDVLQHKPCEDGTVVGWDSRRWGITRPQARVRDDTLQCGMLNLLGRVRVKRGNSETQITQVTTNTNAREFLSTAAPFLSTLALISATVSSPPQQAANPGGHEESAVITTIHPTTAASTEQNSSYLSLITVAPTLTGNQTAFSTLSTDSTVVVQCNLSQFCDNKASYYWMFVSVEVEGSTMSEQDVKAWFSDLFRPECDLGDLMQSSSTTLATYSNNISDGITTGTASTSTLCQKNSTVALQDISVDCEDEKDFKKTNCTVLIQLSQPTDTCSMRQLLQDQRRKSSLHVELMGEVERVGKNLCVDENMLPPGDGFVYCNSSLPSSEICQAKKPVSVTCSYEKKSFTPRVLNEAQAQACDNNTQKQCSCSRFCSDSGAFYAFSLNVSSLGVTFDDVKNTITQLDSPCSSTIHPSLCNVSSHYQGVHIQCHGNRTRLYSCLVALQLSQLLDLCLVSEALAALYKSNTFITYDGTLTRLALCGSVGDSAYSLLNSNFTWVSANISAEQLCSLSPFSLNTQYTCGTGQVLSVLLNESCTVEPYKIGTRPSQTPYTPPSTDTTTTVNTTNPIDKDGSATPNTTSSPSISLANLASNTTDTANNATSSPDSITEAQPRMTTSDKVLTTLGATVVTSTEATTRSTIAPVPPQPAVQTTTTTTTTTKTETTTSGSPDELANQLLNQTLNQDMSTLNASQLEQLVNGVENMLSGPNISLELGQKVLSLIDRLLGSSTNAMASSSNRLIKAVDMLGLKLFIQDKKESITVGSLALMVTKIDGTNFMGASFSVTDPVSLQVNSRRRRSASSPMGSISLPASLTENLSLVEQQQASRVQFTIFSKSTLFQEKTKVPGKNLTLNSHILGTSVANLSIKGLRENVVFTLRNEAPVTGNLTCVFWDFEKNYGSGGWNNTGCAVLNTSTENETVCGCNHLTSFAVLMDLSRDVITDPVQATILTFITYIGCGISAIFLAVTLLSYLAFEKIRRDIPSKLLINLCFALLLLNMVFLLDSWLALYADAVGLCISTAFFLHYFLLASFTWMGLEALHLYLAIVKVFNNFMSRYILKFALAGWGVPLLVVIIVIAVDKNNYGLITYAKYTDGTTDDFCWLKNNTAFYVAVVAYFCVIFVFNMVMFVVVMVQLRRIKRQNPHNNQYRSGLQDLRSIAGLTILLGLTWGFAFFAWGVVSLAFMYLFTIFNSLQGFFIFVFHCAIKETVRRQWRTYLCCGKYRLAENSDWSRTATQNTTKKTSLVTANSGSRTQTASRSSSLSTNSIPQSNNSSVEDSTSTTMEGSSGDVLLNEINSQHRPLHRTD